LATTNYWRRQNICGDKILSPTEMFTSTEIIDVDKILTWTKISRRNNSRLDKILVLTKISCQQKSHVDKILAPTETSHRKMLAHTFGSAKSTAADFSQTSLKISYVAQMVLSCKV
jgi:hypothetical protein